MQSNISINLWEKNNNKRPVSQHRTRKPANPSQPALSSEAFLRHRNKPAHQNHLASFYQFGEIDSKNFLIMRVRTNLI